MLIVLSIGCTSCEVTQLVNSLRFNCVFIALQLTLDNSVVSVSIRYYETSVIGCRQCTIATCLADCTFAFADRAYLKTVNISSSNSWKSVFSTN